MQKNSKVFLFVPFQLNQKQEIINFQSKLFIFLLLVQKLLFFSLTLHIKLVEDQQLKEQVSSIQHNLVSRIAYRISDFSFILLLINIIYQQTNTMFRGLRQIRIQSNTVVQQCSLFNQQRLHKPNYQVSENKKSSGANSKKKIKCPPSKFLKHQKHLSQTFQKKAISPIPLKDANSPVEPINFKQPKTRRHEFNALPLAPVYKISHEEKPPLSTRPVQYVFHSPRQIKEVRKYESPNHNKPLRYFQPRQVNSIKQTVHQSENQYQFVSMAGRLKTLEELEPKMTQSVINSTIDEVRMEQSQIIIDFFNTPTVQTIAKQYRIQSIYRQIELTDSGNSQ